MAADSQLPSEHLGSREASHTSSLPALVPSALVVAPAEQKGLYEVSTGLVAVRPAPSSHCEALCVLKAGHRFYATPYRVGRTTWLRLQSEAHPPLFSTVGGGGLGVTDPAVPTRNYHGCTPSLWTSAPDLSAAMEAWVRQDEQAVVPVRKGRKEFVQEPACDVLELFLPKASLQRSMSTAASGFSKERLGPVRSKRRWAGHGEGAWCNFRSYGVATSPPNTNCGRWRQLPE